MADEITFLKLLEEHFNLELSAVFRGARSKKNDGVYSLTNITAAYDELALAKNRPALSWHIVGSNGKGTCTHYLQHIYTGQGKRTGSFTSPHLLEINERIRIDGSPAAYEDLTAAYHKIAGNLTPGLFSALSFFELLFLIAEVYFRDGGCDTVLYEAGLGGRFDCTKVAAAGNILLTSISLEHTAWLGDTEEKILAEKTAVVTPGIEQTIFFAPPADDPKNLREKFTANITEMQKTHPELAAVIVEPAGSDIDGNYRMVCETISRTVENNEPGGIRVIASETTGALQTVPPPDGRLDTFIKDDSFFIFDCAHNEAAIDALLSKITGLLPPEVRSLQLVIGLLADKDETKINKVIDKRFGQLAARGIETGKISVDVEDPGSLPPPCFNLDAGSGLVVVCGSFRLYKGFRNWMAELKAGQVNPLSVF